MNAKEAAAKRDKELDEILWAEETLATKKEPVLPMKHEDRTEWLLWRTKQTGESMDEANSRYKVSYGQLKRIADGIAARRKVS